jgi:hypothetical protein
VLVALTVSLGCAAAEGEKPVPKNETTTAPDAKEREQTAGDAKPQAAEWRALFDGKTLAGWKTTEFGAHGTPVVEKGLLVVPAGDPLSGVTREKDDVPHVDYEIELEAQRVEGHDFFLALTFPVQDSHASLILGGWSGGVCGISSIDGFDASENNTTSYRKFEDNKWYKVRMRVQKDRLQAWLDEEQIVDADIADRKVSTRVEVSASKPLGLATYMTKAAYRNIRVRKLTPEELKEQPKGEGGGIDPDERR